MSYIKSFVARNRPHFRPFGYLLLVWIFVGSIYFSVSVTLYTQEQTNSLGEHYNDVVSGWINTYRPALAQFKTFNVEVGTKSVFARSTTTSGAPPLPRLKQYEGLYFIVGPGVTLFTGHHYNPTQKFSVNINGHPIDKNDIPAFIAKTHDLTEGVCRSQFGHTDNTTGKCIFVFQLSSICVTIDEMSGRPYPFSGISPGCSPTSPLIQSIKSPLPSWYVAEYLQLNATDVLTENAVVSNDKGRRTAKHNNHILPQSLLSGTSYSPRWNETVVRIRGVHDPELTALVLTQGTLDYSLMNGNGPLSDFAKLSMVCSASVFLGLPVLVVIATFFGSSEWRAKYIVRKHSEYLTEYQKHTTVTYSTM